MDEGVDTRRPFADVAELTSLPLRAAFGDRCLALPDDARVVQVRQVHGAELVDGVELFGSEPVPADGGSFEVEADGVFIHGSRALPPGGMLVAIRTADCVPLLLAAAGDGGEAGFVAAVHAGWRGTVAGIAARAVERARALGIDPSRLHARLGPSIGPCCYEVGEDVAARFEERSLPVARSAGLPRLDLREINEVLLREAGLRSDRIRRSGPCTRCRSDLYWSYRAEPGVAGRQSSWVGWVDPGA